MHLSIQHTQPLVTYAPSFSLVVAFKPLRLHPVWLSSALPLYSLFPSLAGSGLQDGLKLSGHADIILFLTDDALDGGRQAPGVPGEDKGVAVLAAAVVLQGAAGVGDGVVVIVGVNHPVVVAWLDREGEVRECEVERGGIREM